MRCLHRLSIDYKSAIFAALCCVVLWAAPATAQVSWKRVATDTTLTANQVCKTDGTNIICDSTTPTISSGQVGISNTAPGALLDIGTAAATLGTMRLEGNTSGYIQIQPAAAAGSWTMTLPSSAGTNGYVLSTNGSGVTSWIANGGGSGSVNSGTQYQLGYYATTGTGISGDSAITTDVNNVLNITTSTVTTSDPAVNVAQTWNAGAVTFTGIKENITSTASAAASLLMDLQLGGISQFKVDKSGNVTTIGHITDSQSIAAVSTDGLLLTDTTAATVGAQKWSPRLHFTGQGWKTNATAGSQTVDMIAELQPVQGTTNPSGNLTWSSQVNGGGYNALMTLTSGGYIGIGTTAPGTALQVNGVITAGNNASTSGSVIMQGYYSNGALSVWGSEWSSGAPFMGYGVYPSTASTDSFLSATPIAIARAAVTVGNHSGNISFYTGGSQTVASGSAVTMSPVMTIQNGGNVGIGTTAPNAQVDIYEPGSGVSSGVGQTNSGLLIDPGAAVYGLSLFSSNHGTNSNLGWVGEVIGVNAYYNNSSDTLKRYTTSGGFTDSQAITMNSDHAQNGGNRIGFWTGSSSDPTERMSITDNGNVGIGTTSPWATLQVTGTNGATTISGTTPMLALQNTSVASGALNSLMFANAGNYSSAAISVAQTSTGNVGDKLILQTKNTTSGAWNANQLVLNTDGNVGIGTTNPKLSSETEGIVLTVQSTAVSTPSALELVGAVDDANQVAGKIGFLNTYAGNTYEAAKIAHLSGVANANYGQLAFYTANNGSLLERIRITENGTVGIGTATPIEKLHVYGGRVLIDESDGAADAAVLELSNGTQTNYIFTASATDGGDIYIRTDSSKNVLLQTGGGTTGNVGIGTTSPGSSLQVNGGAAVGYSTNTAAPTNGLTVSGNVAIGTTSVPASVTEAVNGLIKVAGTGSEPCGAAQVGSMRYNSTGNYFELCSYP